MASAIRKKKLSAEPRYVRWGSKIISTVITTVATKTAMPATLCARLPVRAACQPHLAVTYAKKAKLASSGMPPPQSSHV